MAPSRYGRGDPRRHILRTKHIRLWFLCASLFCICYLLFLLYWGFGNVSNLERFAPTEQLSNLRKVSNTKHIEQDAKLDVEIAARLEEKRKSDERAHQIPIKMKVPTPPPVKTQAEESRELQKVALEDEKNGNEPRSSGPKIPNATVVHPLRSRHEELYGYPALMKFLESYASTSEESLFLFFMCSDTNFQPNDWSKECVEGKKHVYDVFAKSPGHNRLVTVFAGSADYWNYQNDFSNDRNLRVPGVPCLLKWLGHDGKTEGMLLQRSLYDEPFLRYLFQNTDQPAVLPTPADIQHKQIVTVKGYDGYLDAISKYRNESNPVPTFLMMVSGRFEHNNRPWCPYCRYSELPLEYTFYLYAPKNARMIRIEVTNTYSEWIETTAFLEDPNLHLDIVPFMYSLTQNVTSNGTKSIHFTPHKVRYDELQPLRDLYQRFS